MTFRTQPATIDSAEDDDLQRKERLSEGRWSITPLEKFLIDCDSESSPMLMRVVLRFTGECDVEVLVKSLRRAIGRHPLLNCRLTRNRGSYWWVVDSAERILVSKESGSVFTPENGVHRRNIDLTSEPGLRTEIALMDDGIKVVLDAHHAITDGNGLRQVVTDWLHLYHTSIQGIPPRLPVVDPDRLLNRHRFPQPPEVQPPGFAEAVRNFLTTIKGSTLRWPARVNPPQNSNLEIYCAEEILSEAQGQALRQRLNAWNVTLNDLVMASCMLTLAEQFPEGNPHQRITILNPTDLRLPSDRALPAANRFGFAFIRRTLDECRNREILLKSIHNEMLYVRTKYIGAEFLKGLDIASRVPGGVGFFRRFGFFVPSLQWTCLGDVTRGARRLMVWKDGFLHSGGLRLESASGFAPFAENVPISVAACEAGQQVTLTVRTSPAFLSAEATADFASRLIHQLCSFDMPFSSSEVDGLHRKDTPEC